MGTANERGEGPAPDWWPREPAHSHTAAVQTQKRLSNVSRTPSHISKPGPELWTICSTSLYLFFFFILGNVGVGQIKQRSKCRGAPTSMFSVCYSRFDSLTFVLTLAQCVNVILSGLHPFIPTHSGFI